MTPLPVYVRRITLAVVTLSGLVGFASAQHVAQAMELEALRNMEPLVMAPFDTLDPRLATAVAKARQNAHVEALESMQGPRVLILLGLTIASTLSFVGAVRMLRPAGASREDVRRLLAGTAVACAVLRTIDGAQMTAIAKRIGAASDKVMATGDVVGGYPEGFMATMLSGASLVMTLVVAGSFVLVSMYFRSSKVCALVEASDREREDEG